jgi:hypothetical protein
VGLRNRTLGVYLDRRPAHLCRGRLLADTNNPGERTGGDDQFPGADNSARLRCGGSFLSRRHVIEAHSDFGSIARGADRAHLNRVTTMGELTGPIAHEVNEPIAAAVTRAHSALRWLVALGRVSTVSVGICMIEALPGSMSSQPSKLSAISDGSKPRRLPERCGERT